MEFLCYHRDRPGSQALREQLGEAHWSYMDRYETELIARGRTGGDRFLVLGFGAGEAADLTAPPDRAHLIAYGPLLSDDGTNWLGTATLVLAPDPEAARAVLTPDWYASIEVHNWQFGGRR